MKTDPFLNQLKTSTALVLRSSETYTETERMVRECKSMMLIEKSLNTIADNRHIHIFGRLTEPIFIEE
jgi:hypothetical protein